MDKTLLSLCLLFLGLAVQAQDSSLPIPKGHQQVLSCSGDLDGDGIKEYAIAYNITDQTKANDRELIIFKREADGYVIWKRSSEALQPSWVGKKKDPLNALSIKAGVLLIHHTGGEIATWHQFDKYRYKEGDMYLVGYSFRENTECRFYNKYQSRDEFNLETGNIVLDFVTWSCDRRGGPTVTGKEKEFMIKKGLKVTLEKRNSGEFETTTPKNRRKVKLLLKNS